MTTAISLGRPLEGSLEEAFSRTNSPCRPLLPIQRSAITRLVRFLLAHVGAALRASVPALALEVIDAARDVEPTSPELTRWGFLLRGPGDIDFPSLRICICASE